MGLDMYLNAKRYISEYSDKEVFDELNSVDMPSKGKMKIKGIECSAMYWRKANAIHRWFVENVQGGEDDCNEYDVSREQLYDLLSCCRAVLGNHDLADDLLPTQDGFFFGDTLYGKYYFQDLEETADGLLQVLQDTDGDNWWHFTYRSSW